MDFSLYRQVRYSSCAEGALVFLSIPSWEFSGLFIVYLFALVRSFHVLSAIT